MRVELWIPELSAGPAISAEGVFFRAAASFSQSSLLESVSAPADGCLINSVFSPSLCAELYYNPEAFFGWLFISLLGRHYSANTIKPAVWKQLFNSPHFFKWMNKWWNHFVHKLDISWIKKRESEKPSSVIAHNKMFFLMISGHRNNANIQMNQFFSYAVTTAQGAISQ